MSWSIRNPRTWFSGHEGSDETGSMAMTSSGAARGAACASECAKMRTSASGTWHQSTPGTTSPGSAVAPSVDTRARGSPVWTGEARNESPSSDAGSVASPPPRRGTRRHRDGSHVAPREDGEARMSSPRPELLLSVRAGAAKRRRSTPDGALVLHRAIGHGSGGKVYLAYEACSSPRQWYAVKTARHSNSSWLRNEAYMLTTVLPPHKHVVRMPEHLPPTVCAGTGDVYLPLEYAPDGDLLTVVLDAEEMGMGMMPLQVAEVGRQLAEALRHCHAHSVFHRDVKPDNVLVHKGAGVVRLADFGSATTKRFPSDCCTTSGFAAPEVLRCSMATTSEEATPTAVAAPPYDAAAADVWSLGISLFCTLYTRHPWTVATEEDTFYCDWAAAGRFSPRILDHCVASPGTPDGDALRRMLKLFAAMLAVNPAERPTMAEVAATLEAITRGEDAIAGPTTAPSAPSLPSESEPKSESPQLRAALRTPPPAEFSLLDAGHAQPSHHRAAPRARECELDDDIAFDQAEASANEFASDGSTESRVDLDGMHEDADMATISIVADGSAACS